MVTLNLSHFNFPAVLAGLLANMICLLQDSLIYEPGFLPPARRLKKKMLEIEIRFFCDLLRALRVQGMPQFLSLLGLDEPSFIHLWSTLLTMTRFKVSLLCQVDPFTPRLATEPCQTRHGKTRTQYTSSRCEFRRSRAVSLWLLLESPLLLMIYTQYTCQTRDLFINHVHDFCDLVSCFTT